MLTQSLIADMTTAVSSSSRLYRAMQALKAHFNCDAAVLLKKDERGLRVHASTGLVADAAGRCFEVAHHPRLASILRSRNPVHFPHASELADPYDGLLLNMPTEQLSVHDCMGISIYIDGICWGALTLDAAEPGTFSSTSENDLRLYALALEACIRMNRLEFDNHALRSTHGRSLPAEASSTSNIIGNDAAFTQLLQDCRLVASSELPVLILGETGTGKELIAQLIHQHSSHGTREMVYVNCAALPETLAESELFGHIKGAFSGAHQSRQGRFEQAHGSTLFLDEVGELPLSIQAKLLRVVQSGEIQRLGSDKYHRVDVRTIAATNRDLAQMVRDGSFRADLYHRLSVYPVKVPPLRSRGQDILLLAGHFLEINRARLGFRSLRLSAAAEQCLLAYQWPGNIRELEHVISRASIRLLGLKTVDQSIMTLDPSLLTDITSEPATSQVAIAERVDTTVSSDPVDSANKPCLALKEQVLIAQRQAITVALEYHNGQWAAAARELDVDASNLHKLARKLGLKK